MKTTTRLATGTVAGLLSALCGVGVSMLVAALTLAPTATEAVGNRFIRMTPEWLKEFAIETFGTHDKLVLTISIFVVLGLFAIAVGVIAWRSRILAVILTAVLGAAAVVASATDPTALVGPFTKVLPSVAALIASAAAMWWITRSFQVGEADHA